MMIAFIVTTFVCFITYLLLTTGSGKDLLGLWSWAELVFGATLSIIVGIVGRKLFVKKSFRMLNPVRWFAFLAYLFVFFYEMTKANFDVAYRVITGKINPGIVKISPDLKTDLGITMLANSITLTPGTLSVDIDENANDLYIHWINVKEEALKKKPVDPKYICGSFPKWVRRVAE